MYSTAIFARVIVARATLAAKGLPDARVSINFTSDGRRAGFDEVCATVYTHGVAGPHNAVLSEQYPTVEAALDAIDTVIAGTFGPDDVVATLGIVMAPESAADPAMEG